MITRKKVLTVLFLTLLDIEFGMSRMLMKDQIDFTDCGGKYDIISLDISSCYTLPCILEQGNFVYVTYELDLGSSNSKVDRISFEGYWLVGGTRFDALIRPTSCSLGDCLSNANSKLVFTVQLYVSELTNKMTNGVLIWNTKDYTTRDTFACARVPVYFQ